MLESHLRRHLFGMFDGLVACSQGGVSAMKCTVPTDDYHSRVILPSPSHAQAKLTDHHHADLEVRHVSVVATQCRSPLAHTLA